MHIGQLVGERLGVLPAAAGNLGMFDTRQFANIAAAGGDDQPVVVKRCGFQLQGLVLRIDSFDAGLNIINVILLQKIM